jgi:hypothetical protein
MKALSFFVFALLCAAPALASVTVKNPVNGSSVTSPFSLSATATACSNQSIASMGYSLDSSPNAMAVKGSSIAASVTAALGSHTLHVKSWGVGGAACRTDVAITVVKPVTSTTNLAVTVPVSGATVGSPFSLAAAGTLCSGKAITSVGYSLDSSSTTTTQSGTSLTANVSAKAGSHTLHVKSWGNGASCSTSVSIQVSTAANGPSIPSTATATKLIQNLDAWSAAHDAGTTGTSSGTMSMVSSPSMSGSARKFATKYTSYGGERYNVELAHDATATNFVYDAQIYLASPSSDISNIEMDLNQVLTNGNTVIYGFQCDAWSKTWDYCENSGSISNSKAHWIHSNQTCNPQKWAANTWHHVQLQYSRDSTGNVTYNGVWLDGVEQQLNVTVLSAFGLGWGQSLNSNFQIGGFTSTSGSSTVYLDDVTLYSW